MTTTKFQFNLAAALLVLGGTAVVFETRRRFALQKELGSSYAESGDRAALRAENVRLARAIEEAAELRGGSAALAQVEDEAKELQGRLAKIAGLEAAQALAKAAADDQVGTLDGEPVYDISKTDVQPRPKAQSRPLYPASLRGSGITGEVTLEFIVDKNGEVRNVHVVKSTHCEFEEAAMASLGKSKFLAAARNGAMVHTRIQVTVRFTPNRSEKASGTN